MEQIKQEIINNIYENGENLITGPVLQTVLLDMVDDVNSKVASASVAPDIVDKTGSWDDAADWVEENSSSLVHENDLDGYATEQWVENQGYLKEHQDLGGYATTESLNDLSESVANDLANLPEPDLSDYATKEYVEATSASVKEWVENKHYLTTASLSGSVTEESVQFMINDATSSVKTWVGDQNYATETFVSQAIAEIPGTDLTGYATEQWVEEQGYLTEHQDISGLATTQSVTSLSESVAQDFANLDIPDVSGLATTESVNQLSESIAQTIEDLPQVDLNGYVTTASYNADSASFDQRINNIPVIDPSEYVTTGSFGDLEGRVDTLEEGVAYLANAKDALEGAEIITWDDENEEWTAVPLATSESVGLLSQSVSQSIVDSADLVSNKASASITSLSESFAETIANLPTGSAADLSGYATTASVNQLSESIADDFANLEIPDVSGLATTQSVNNLSASFDQRLLSASGLTYQDLNDLGLVYDTDGEGNWSARLVPEEGTGSFDEEAPAIWRLLRDKNLIDIEEDENGWRISYFLETAEWINNPVGKFLEAISEGKLATLELPEGAYQDIWVSPIVREVESLSASVAAMTGSSADLSGYATTASVNQLSSSVADDFANLEIPDVSGYATTESVNTLSASFDQRINDLPGGEKIWVRGEGSGSAVLSGSRSTASGKGSVAEGELTKALRNYSHAEGYYTTASGLYSHAEGTYTIASGSYSHAEGYGTIASGSYSHAEGNYTIASGKYSHAEGAFTTASEYYSHAEGNRTVASGKYSHAEGSGSEASGTSSHAEGLFTTASGTGSHAQGLYTIVRNEYEVGIGKFNTRTDQNHRGRIFSLGVGTDDSNRKDAIVVYTGSVGPRILVYGVGGYDGTNPDSAKTLAQTISEITGSDLSGYATTESVNQISYSVDYRLDQLEQEKEIPFWSSGSGEYSVVRKNGSFAEALGEGSIFLGYGGGRIINANYYRCEYGTWAPQPSDSNPKYYLSHEVNSSQWDQVEVGQNLVSDNDHQGKRVAQVVSKGQDTSGETAGMYWITLSTYVGTPVWLMLVEVGSRIAGKGAIGGGCGTDTSNDYETGLGKYSRSGSGQIFSVGVGSSKTDRRNAISIVTGSNPSASVYIYGVGSYDGTNPQPGTNDLASVIASGGTSYNVETWTFVLEDSSSVTKNVVVA